MEIYVTSEGYVNLVQEGRNFILTVTRIIDFVTELQEKFLVEDEWETPFHKVDKDLKILCLPIADNFGVNDKMFDEYIEYLSSLLGIAEDILLELDYLNLRDF